MPAETISGLSAGRATAAATDRLRAAGSPSPRLDAELLVAHALDRDRTWLLANPQAPLDAVAAAQLDAWVARRATGEPVAYLRGFKEWFGLRIAVDSRVLIPRPETELLAELAIEEISARLVREATPIHAWEVGTGSGAISVAVGRRVNAALSLAQVVQGASDMSAGALEVAAANLATHGLGDLVLIKRGHLLEPTASIGPLDLVVANLPYLTSAEVASGVGSLAHEPREALDGGADGLDALRELVAALPDHLARDGVALLEVGDGQAGPVAAMAERLPMPTRVAAHPDLAGVERVVRITRLSG